MARQIPKPPKAFKAKVTVIRKNGEVIIKRYNSRENDASLDILIDTFDYVKEGSRVIVQPTHVNDLAVDTSTFLEYLFSYDSGVPGDFVQYKSIIAKDEAEARVNALCDETWVLLATAPSDELDYKSFTGTTPIV